MPQTPKLREQIRGELRWALLRRPVAMQHIDGRFAYLVVDGDQQILSSTLVTGRCSTPLPRLPTGA